MGLERLIQTLRDIEFPTAGDDFPGACRIVDTCREFFSQGWVQDMMLDINRTNIHDKRIGVSGNPVGYYTERNKRRKGYAEYDYYDSGATSESLMVYAGDEGVFVGFDESAPPYAADLNPDAWGVPLDEMEVFNPELITATREKILDFIRNN